MTHGYSQSWHGIEGVRGGMPELSRARNISNEAIADLHYPNLFIITRRYVSEHRTLLPTSEEYIIINRFEVAVIDEIENKHLGILVWTQTGSEMVKYYLYVRDIELVVQLINTHASCDDQIDMATEKDSNWKIYQAMKSEVGL